MDAKRAIEEAGGDMQKATELIAEKGLAKAKKKSDREVKSGLIYAYVHPGGNVGAMIELNCETDFVAKNEEFVNLAKEIALQVASMNPENVEELLKQAYIRDGSKTIEQLLTTAIGKIGENMQIKRFVRYELNE